ncbi:MAG: GIY-YIG nuclease family protein [Pseudolabrys sp.]|nr:GIY-YIG nuclease family protein [Pseudolabrys sp.]MDP2297437.1 GIY-YIG nuclease family protein [Pseudolabrys sp.]
MADRFYVYILANRPKGVLYVGATSDLVRRVGEHKGKYVPGFTAKHFVTRLVYFEEHASILDARARERSMKRWARAWKFAIIEKQNPDWLDLTDQLMM